MVAYVVRSVPERAHYLAALQAQLPGLIVIADRVRSAMDTFCRALQAVPDGGVLLEDDALLTVDFRGKAEAVIEAHPDEVVNFFSRNAADVTHGARRCTASGFRYTLCFYLPPEMGEDIWAFYPEWPSRHYERGGCDVLVADYLSRRGLRFWQHVPSLVQHREGVSSIDPRRARKRQSRTFV